ncbi:hypothetical protein [Clostridium luticellarii]|uniref:Uncharacterized protein n=1 Tax=Clostridium luticellarii TaxID=1691940 RepID=A0A2T0BA01_9CLOT|nr:hypothetical protein [Clostridium luticellarii]MCI1945188.1 hypothetical protein [Clostridium luticellarii]MCI1968850.1 hypothetical protein [Clostridium luticellarii]MCI1995636.1 hypothetical protein [Clostridium luticellarii]MCI2040024.1 hypothetical protein [Clostridium luticellarii]PRR80731.1 hypothetical protein CLLU_33210 [Clostridium luticellarii]
MDIESKFLNIINNNFKESKSEDSFVICPKIFYSGLNEREIFSMQQIYNEAYNRAVKKVEDKYRGFYI